MNSSCSREVFTATGKFTFHDQLVSICEAKKICAENDEILAPITNKQDYDAVMTVAKSGNHPGCPFHHGDQQYFTGLDVTPCGKGKQERVFTNGVVWDESVHGKLYDDSWNSKMYNCVYASLATWSSQPWLEIWGNNCYQETSRFLCLKPSSAPAADTRSKSCKLQAVQSKGEVNFASASVICFCGFASVFLAFAAVKYYRKYRSIKEKHVRVKASV